VEVAEVDLALEVDVRQVDSLVVVDLLLEEVLAIDRKENADHQVIENLLVKKEVLVLTEVHLVLEIENLEDSEENQSIKSSKLVKKRICKIRYGN
jgi:hypothetical protein